MAIEKRATLYTAAFTGGHAWSIEVFDSVKLVITDHLDNTVYMGNRETVIAQPEAILMDALIALVPKV